MDPHIRWLRRVLVSRALARVAGEALFVAGGSLAAAVLAEIGPVVAALLAAVAAQGFIAVRLAVAILTNPVNHRYLMAWRPDPHRLQPSSDETPCARPLDDAMAADGLHHLVTLETTDHERPDAGPVDRHQVYSSPSRLVVASVGADGRQLTVLSRLTDGRLLVTTCETVPPHRRVVVNLSERGSPSDLLLCHMEALGSLHHRGLAATRAGYETVIDQLDLEWRSWNQLGPFVGPLLAVDPRRQPHILHVRIPAGTLRDRWSTVGGERAGFADRRDPIRPEVRAPVG